MIAEVEQKLTDLVQIGRFGACARKRLLPRHTLKATNYQEIGLFMTNFGDHI